VTTQTMMTYQRIEELDGRVAAAVLQWTLALADTKHKLGIRTSEWINGSPALEAAVGASAITQDELGHARSLFAFLKEFPGAPEGIGAENDLEARDDYHCPRLLNDPWPSWLDVIAANVLVDRALNVAVEAFRDSTFAPLRGRCAKIVQEEEFHRIFGDSWLARLAGWDEEKRGKLQESLNHFWGTAVGWFGPDDDPIALTLYQQGILQATPAEMRRRWLEQVGPLLQKNGLTSPAADVDWSGWNAAYRDLV